jgi:hypothetical protein
MCRQHVCCGHRLGWCELYRCLSWDMDHLLLLLS